jgi:hypothetical protein
LHCRPDGRPFLGGRISNCERDFRQAACTVEISCEHSDYFVKNLAPSCARKGSALAVTSRARSFTDRFRSQEAKGSASWLTGVMPAF